MKSDIGFMTQDLIALYNGYRYQRYVVKRLFSLSASKRKWLLRHHSEELVEEDEIEIRDKLDEVLGLASVLEILSICIGETPPLDRDFCAALLKILENPEVITFYEDHYPVPLPCLFRQRLRGDLSANFLTQAKGEAAGKVPTRLTLFRSFTDIDLRWQTNDDLHLYLALLDDYIIDDVYIDDVISAITNVKRLAHVMNCKTERNELLRSAVLGFDEFVSICTEIDSLLKRTKGAPLLAAAIWAHFSYWFWEGRDAIRGTTGRVEKRVRAWTKPEDRTPNEKRADARIAKMHALLMHLTSAKRYLPPLVKSAGPVLMKWKLSLND
jgi:hypothetical protein